MLIRAETAGQSLSILGKKGRRGGGAEPRVKERGENRNAEEERTSSGRERRGRCGSGRERHLPFTVGSPCREPVTLEWVSRPRLSSASALPKDLISVAGRAQEVGGDEQEARGAEDVVDGV